MAKKLIRFDWAMKTLLRDKANFDVLEGFLGALLNDDTIHIITILESESNQETENDKFNRVDLLVEDGEKRKFIIEIQNTHESDYLERLLFGTSKVIVENMSLGQDFSEVKKVISVSILYFNLGEDNDYLYYGTTEIRGVNTNKPLVVRKRVEKLLENEIIIKYVEKKIFPEYYFINVEKYKNVISKNIDEWIYMMKNNEVKANFSSKNIDKAAKKLEILNMTDQERKAYERYMINVAIERDKIGTAKMEGKAEGKMEEKIEMAKIMIVEGESNEKIKRYTGLKDSEIDSIRNHTKN